jgi:hypothetical protein
LKYDPTLIVRAKDDKEMLGELAKVGFRLNEGEKLVGHRFIGGTPGYPDYFQGDIVGPVFNGFRFVDENGDERYYSKGGSIHIDPKKYILQGKKYY